MSKLVTIKFKKHNFEPEYDCILSIFEENFNPIIISKGKLCFDQNWLDSFNELTFYDSIKFKTRHLEFTELQKTNISVRNWIENVKYCLNDWLDSKSFRPIKEKLLEKLHPSESIRVNIQTDDIQVWKLPWQLWNFLERYPRAEVTYSLNNCDKILRNFDINKDKKYGKMLVILGHNKGINVDADRQYLEGFRKYGMKIICLVEPTLTEINDYLYGENFDILYFGGHGQTRGEEGLIHINQSDIIDIGKLKYSLRQAGERGLKLFICNCCDGLGLAKELGDLNFSQVIVWKYSVPDKIALEKIKYFLDAFSRGLPLHLALRTARERLCDIDYEANFPSEIWSPILCQNPIEVQPIWEDLGGVSSLLIEQKWKVYRKFLKTLYTYLKCDYLDSIDCEYPIKLRQLFVLPDVREGLPIQNTIRNYQKQPKKSLMKILRDSNSYQYLTILGNPGSGKSTLLQYLVLEWIETEERCVQTVTLLIELRQYSYDPTLPTNFFDFFYERACKLYEIEKEQLEKLLGSVQVLILLDGLDEVFELAIRESIITEIIYLTHKYPMARIIITSRIIGYKPNRLRDARFHHFTLEDFGDEEISDWITRWCDLVCSDNFEKIERQKRLQSAVKNSPRIRELARNPLLLTMMAIISRYQELPHNRVELYKQASKVLLDRIDREKCLPVPPDTVTLRDKESILRQLAYEMMVRTPEGRVKNKIWVDDLQQLLTGYLRRIEIERPRHTANIIIEQLRTRNFILFGDEYFSFVHQTFLEYFCAEEFVYRFEKTQTISIEELKANVFGKYWFNSSWHEILCLIASMIHESFVSQIIDYLIDRDGSDKDFANLFLAARCLSEVQNRSEMADIEVKLLEQMKILTCESNLNSDFLLGIKAIRAIAKTWTNTSGLLTWFTQLAYSNEHELIRKTAMEQIEMNS